ncbi:hypothetical protein VO419_004146 [Vibrio parahaemolyticus]|nr:hypothetical protein [Vibrio parahaemolyticus]
MKAKVKTWIEKQLLAHGYVKKASIDQQLNFARNIAKRLDEHREVVEAIEKRTDLLDTAFWHISHLATQDDYLMRLFKLVHGHYPDTSKEGQDHATFEGKYVRPRPVILGECQLPDYVALHHKREVE